MSHWVRLWDDMPTDPKWRVIAKRAGRPIPEVMAVFLFMLSNAGGSSERGTLENWNDEDVAAALDIDEAHVAAIRSAMQGKTLDGDKLTGWEKRQPKRERDDDNSTERVKAFRERQRHVTPCNATERLDKIREDKIEEEKDAREKPSISDFEKQCRDLVGSEPVLLALDFHSLETLTADGGVTQADVVAGIQAAMAKADFRPRRWGQFEGWARRAAQDRMAGKAKGHVNGYKSPVTPDKRIWLPQGSPGYEAWRTAFPGVVRGTLTTKGAEPGIFMPTEYPPKAEAAA